MVLRAHFLILLTAALFSFVHGSMNNNLIEFIPSISDNRFEKLSSDEERGIDIIQDNPSYLNIIEDGEFKGLIKENTDNIPTLEEEKYAELHTIKTVNVMSFGVKGDGKHDDSAGFEEAWKTACSSTTQALVVVPKGRNYLLKPTTFSGPCISSITFQILGTLQASTVRSDYKNRYWLLFKDVINLVVNGGGTINGNGKIWWQHSCKINKKLPCKGAPTALTFYNNNNLAVNNLKIKDAQQIQVSFQKCMNVYVSHITITAPDESPNTDGIHVTNTQNIQIKNCVIGTGDDCISIVSGSKNVQATDITCGPGHGISIGSLGKHKSESHVSGVIVNRAKLTGTTNGVRIKTWQGGSGSVNNIQFQNIVMNNVKNPILIDQHYCDQKSPCTTQKNAVQVKNVVYKNIKGTSSSNVAIKFDCSKTYPCQGIVLQNIDLTLKSQTKKAKAYCSNVKLAYIGGVSPKC